MVTNTNGDCSGPTYLSGEIVRLRAENERLREEAASLRLQARSFEILAEHATDMISRHSCSGEILYVSPAVRTLIGYEPRDIVGRRVQDFVHPDDTANTQWACDRAQSMESTDTAQYRFLTKRGVYIWVETKSTTWQDDAVGSEPEIVAITRDINDRKLLEQELVRASITDPLTGLYNRLHFNRSFEREMERYRRLGESFSLIMLDVDRFKYVNDEHGHDVGDRVLVGLSAQVQAVIRSIDVVSRWGGDEFVILLPGTDRSKALSLAERLRERLADIVLPNGSHVTCSFGVAELSPNDDYDSIIKRADNHLYAAKHKGRDKVIVD